MVTSAEVDREKAREWLHAVLDEALDADDWEINVSQGIEEIGMTDDGWPLRCVTADRSLVVTWKGAPVGKN